MSINYRIINRVLTALIVALGLYLALGPLLPEVTYRLERTSAFAWVLKLLGRGPRTEVVSFVTPRVSMAAESAAVPEAPLPEENIIVIPAIGVDSPVIEGATSSALERGIWHRPGSSTPDKGGNTVLVGHRFLYTSGPKTFYHLDKLKIGDDITVFWQKKAYRYIVESTTVVSPLALEIEQPTVQPVLTLYTCTPLLSVDKRLVVRARLAD